MKPVMIVELVEGIPLMLEVSDYGSSYAAEMPEVKSEIQVSSVYFESSSVVISTPVAPPRTCHPGFHHTWQLWQEGNQWKYTCTFTTRDGSGRSPIWTIDPKNVTKRG